jgi:hypothetical protein
MSLSSQIEAKDVVIIIHVYKNQISEPEQKALQQCSRVLSNYDIVVIHSEELDISIYKTLIPQMKSVVFKKQYFGTIKGYNKLLISDFFYQTFSRYKYLLMFHLDAWVFEDVLLEWCNKGYDYIGAPWIEEPVRGKTSALIPFTKLCVNQVGNGGFCLRKVSTHLRIAKRLKFLTHFYSYNEDVFWSIFVPMIFKSYRKPTVQEALSFAFEYKPRESYVRIGNRLPFGCHAWERTDRQFWNQFIHLNE